MKIETEIEPRWEFDCGHCKFSQACGPVCACLPGAKPNLKKQHWFPVRVPGKHWVSRARQGIGVAEVRHTRLEKGSRIVYRLGGRSKEGGRLRIEGKWTKGILTGVTSRWHGTVWGFKILSIMPV